jgi:outer membrane protein
MSTPLLCSLRHLALATAAFVLFSQSANADNLLEAYQQALASDPIVAQAQHQLQADLQDKPLARSAWLPHINLAAGAAGNHSLITNTDTTPIDQTYPSNNYSVTLSQTLFNGQAFSALSQADARIQASQAALDYALQQLSLKVVTSYLNVLQAIALERVSEEHEKLLSSLREQAEVNMQVGTGDIISVSEARAQWDAAKADVIRTRNAVAVARSNLQRLTHHSVVMLDDLKAFEPLGPQPDQVLQWVDQALENQPQVRQAQAQLRVAQEQVEFNGRARWPVLNITGSAAHARGSIYPNLMENQAIAGVTLTMPLYDGGAISATVDQAHSLADVSLDALTNVRDQVTLDTQTAFLNLKDSVAQLHAASEAVDSGKVSLDGTRTGFEIGTRSMIDVLNTATDYIRAEQDYNVARYSQVLSRVQLKAAAGVLAEQDLLSVNALLAPAKP